jgi:glucose-6-phosphate 1-dehydrogenase
LGVGTRAGYFDTSGITRDIVQNHALQMLSLLTIEPPISLLDADAIRDEKVKVLKSIVRPNHWSVPSSVVRGRYSSGLIKGEQVPGYLEEPGISPTSMTETFVAMELHIDNWRWSGVPMFLRVGKRLPKRTTEIAVNFKRQPATLLKGCRPSDPNVLVFQVQPEEGIHLTVNTKMPGPRYPMRPVTMDFTNEASFGVQSPDAYERLLVDAMRGDPTLFARGDEIEQAWSIIDPILTAWSGPEAPPLFEYPSGSWGPDEAHQLLARHRATWRKL